MALLLRAASLLALTRLAWCVPSPDSLGSPLSIVVENDLQGSSSPSASTGVIVLHEKLSLASAKLACEALGEALWPAKACARAGPRNIFGALGLEGPQDSRFWIQPEGNISRSINARGEILPANESIHLPALCTQHAPFSDDTFQDTGKRWQTEIWVNNEHLVGFRDRFTFRFLGVRYAPNPPKLAHSSMYRGNGGAQAALNHGPWCIWGPFGEEDCLFLNIYTTQLPMIANGSSSAPRSKLKPVIVYIHGGGFQTGYGSDPTFDGGNLASRGDVVVVSIQYRLGAVGFLALDDGTTNGNYGLGDMVTALDWVQNNIHAFGGDADRVTLMGSSAGANAIRALMGSPKAAGKFAGVIKLSLTGGLAFGELLQRHYPIPELVEMASSKALAATNCKEAASQVECLRAIDSRDLWWAGLDARLLSIDGKYLTGDEFSLFQSPPTQPVHVMMGINAEDGLPLISFPALPPNATVDDPSWLVSQGLPAPDTTLSPIDASLENRTLAVYKMWARLATDAFFRCTDQSHLHAGLETGVFAGGRAYFYEFERTYQPPEWPGIDLCEAPRSASHPFGDTKSPAGNMRCHNGETLYVFGNLARRGLPHRDAEELAFERYVLDSFASFARTWDPNPDPDWLSARGYDSTLEMLRRSGRWTPSEAGKAEQVKILDVSRADGDQMMRGLRDVEQCEWLGLPLDYWMPLQIRS